jgi:hypothetical protein
MKGGLVIVLGFALFVSFFSRLLCALCGESRIDPAAWGGDHVGKPLPEFVTGDECLFCHRNDVGPAWASNRHQLTLREADPKSPALAALREAPGLKDFAAAVTLTMGRDHRQRFLKRSPAYGKLDLLSVAWQPPGKLLHADKPHWDAKTFADGCAGCHTSGVSAKDRTFSALALDCYTCHGVVDLKHAKDPSLALFAKKRPEPARVVTSVCASCHVRTGKSKSTGLPYPNQFVPGDNLFRDFQVDLSPEAIKAQNPMDRHVLDNVRDVVLLGKEDVTCLSCHDVHKQSSKKHHNVAKSDACLHCHNATGPKKMRPAYEVHSATCGY